MRYPLICTLTTAMLLAYAGIAFAQATGWHSSLAPVSIANEEFGLERPTSTSATMEDASREPLGTLQWNPALAPSQIGSSQQGAERYSEYTQESTTAANSNELKRQWHQDISPTGVSSGYHSME